MKTTWPSRENATRERSPRCCARGRAPGLPVEASQSWTLPSKPPGLPDAVAESLPSGENATACTASVACGCCRLGRELVRLGPGRHVPEVHVVAVRARRARSLPSGENAERAHGAAVAPEPRDLAEAEPRVPDLDHGSRGHCQQVSVAAPRRCRVRPRAGGWLEDDALARGPLHLDAGSVEEPLRLRAVARPPGGEPLLDEGPTRSRARRAPCPRAGPRPSGRPSPPPAPRREALGARVDRVGDLLRLIRATDIRERAEARGPALPGARRAERVGAIEDAQRAIEEARPSARSPATRARSTAARSQGVLGGGGWVGAPRPDAHAATARRRSDAPMLEQARGCAVEFFGVSGTPGSIDSWDLGPR